MKTLSTFPSGALVLDDDVHLPLSPRILEVLIQALQSLAAGHPVAVVSINEKVLAHRDREQAARRQALDELASEAQQLKLGY